MKHSQPRKKLPKPERIQSKVVIELALGEKTEDEDEAMNNEKLVEWNCRTCGIRNPSSASNLCFACGKSKDV